MDRRSILKGAGSLLGGGSLIAGGFADEVVSASQVNSPLKEVYKKNKGGSTDWSKEGPDAFLGKSFGKNFSTLNITHHLSERVYCGNNCGPENGEWRHHCSLQLNCQTGLSDGTPLGKYGGSIVGNWFKIGNVDKFSNLQRINVAKINRPNAPPKRTIPDYEIDLDSGSGSDSGSSSMSSNTYLIPETEGAHGIPVL
jgi:hypothetical protein